MSCPDMKRLLPASRYEISFASYGASGWGQLLPVNQTTCLNAFM